MMFCQKLLLLSLLQYRYMFCYMVFQGIIMLELQVFYQHWCICLAGGSLVLLWIFSGRRPNFFRVSRAFKSVQTLLSRCPAVTLCDQTRRSINCLTCVGLFVKSASIAGVHRNCGKLFFRISFNWNEIRLSLETFFSYLVVNLVPSASFFHFLFTLTSRIHPSKKQKKPWLLSKFSFCKKNIQKTTTL